jgi:hypothetical protein
VCTVLLDDRGYVVLLKLYLARAGYQFGPAFRASINGNGGPLSYDATELINAGVSIEAARRRRDRAGR